MVVGAAAASERPYVMRRRGPHKVMGRWLLNVTATTSLVLSLATLSLWVRGYWVCDSVHWYVPATVEGVHVVKFHSIKAGYGVLMLSTSYIRYSGEDAARPPEHCPECGALSPPHNPPMQRTATASSGAVE